MKCVARSHGPCRHSPGRDTLNCLAKLIWLGMYDVTQGRKASLTTATEAYPDRPW
jgi:hypothetical protein